MENNILKIIIYSTAKLKHGLFLNSRYSTSSST